MSSQDINSQDAQQNQQGSNSNYSNFNNGGNLVVPNSVAVLILGILSIVVCWCYGILSAVLAIIAIVLANTAEKEYKLNPNAYSLASYKNLKAGKTCAIIGLCLAGLTILCFVIYIIVVGSLAFNLLNFGLTN